MTDAAGDVGEPLAFSFDADHAHRTAEELSELLGGKGAGLATMAGMGLPVPPGFTLTTAACRRYLADGWSDEFEDAVRCGLAELEVATGRRLGDPAEPLLVSVRSGARFSMPGMMDTVLDVGMTDAVAAGLAERTGDPDFAADTYRRALRSYAEIVCGASEHVLIDADATIGVTDLRSVLDAARIQIPTDPFEQVVRAVRAVFDSWSSARAVRYREIEGIDDAIGTAATVQAMVFGNLGDSSGTGVAFTRDPSTGAAGLMGDFLVGAQGEDVVAGTHATRPLAEMATRWPDAWDELRRIADRLEHDLADMVDIEFTVEQGRLWMLQARRGKRSPAAVFRTAVDMAEDPAFPLDRAGAVERCRHLLADPPTAASTDPDAGEGPDADVDRADQDDVAAVVATGLAASPGRAVGVLCTDVDRAVDLESSGVDVVLVRRETSPADVHGMAAARGLVTCLGGLVSHAAVVARSWGLPAVVGAADLTLVDGGIEGPGGRVDDGTVVTVDGDGGRLLLGAHARAGRALPEVEIVRAWAAELDRAGSAAPVGGLTVVGQSVGGHGSVVPDADWAVLHFLRIKGMVPVGTLAGMTGLADEAVVEILGALRAADHAAHHEGRDLWHLTAGGREEHARRLAEVVAGRPLGDLDYEAFLALNDSFKALCTDWQLRDGAPNDHADADHDRRVLDRLREHDDRARTVIAGFPAVLPWTCRYAERLAAACERAVDGDHRAFTGVLCDSYHDIWMELHEDLILSQGIDRAAEGST